MIEYVFRHSRMFGDKRVTSRVFSGRYALAKGERPVTVCLNTPDKEIARKRLRALVVEKQREQEGIIAPKSIRTTAMLPLDSLVSDSRAICAVAGSTKSMCTIPRRGCVVCLRKQAGNSSATCARDRSWNGGQV